MNRANHPQRAQIAAQIMAALVSRRDKQSALERAFETQHRTRESQLSEAASDAVAAADALIAALNQNESSRN